MKILAFDLESTNIDPKLARIVELCFCHVDIDETTSEQSNKVWYSTYLWDKDYPELSKEIQNITHIDPYALMKEGLEPRSVLMEFVSVMGKSDFICAHNARRYDKILLEQECLRWGIEVPKKPWIDTRYDIVYPERSKCRVLSHLAIDLGFDVTHKELHNAAGDVGIMLKILSKFDIKEVIRRATAKRIIVKANVSFEQNQKAKDRQYRWQQLDKDGDFFTKSWIKEILDFELETEKKEAGFLVTVLKEYQNT